MASPLESAITLEDVFAMVVGKRVPLAPELAGYLSLEIAEKADAAGWGGGPVEPRSVYIADEGTVALVRPRGGAGAGGAGGDTESSIRGILAQLLDASGSSTPALSAVARRGATGSLRALMEDVEAALIPVNRAAGRRALARLAREVKRVTHGVGRNASSPGRTASGEWAARGSRPDEVSGARRDRVDAPESRGVSRLPRVMPPPRPAAPPAEAFGVPDSLQPASREPEPPEAPAEMPAAIFDNPADVDSLLEQFSRSTTQSEEAVSKGLKDLVDVGQTALPPAVQPRPRSAPPPAQAPQAPFPAPTPHPRSVPPSPDVDDLLALTEDTVGPAQPAGPVSAGPVSRAPASRGAIPTGPASTRAAPAQAAPPSSRAADDRRNLPTFQSLPVAEWARPKRKRTDYWLVIALLGVLAAASATVWFFKPGFLSGRTAEKVAEEKAANEAARVKAAAAQQALNCHATLEVTDVPTGAEVLIRVGQAPVDVPHLPVGARLEFVATAEGYAPKRVVVASSATWDNGPDGRPRFEVAVQLDRSNPKAKLGDAWPPGEAGSEVGGKGPPGTVHLVSSPRGAEMWMLAGLAPDALIEQLPCDQALDVLVAGPTTYRKRLHAAASDFTAKAGEATTRTAKLSAR